MVHLVGQDLPAQELERNEVTIVQRRLTHYRVPFFEALRHGLKERGIRLRVLYGTTNSIEAEKNDSGHLEWGEVVQTHYFLGGRICWQDFGPLTYASDLVIITQENKLVSNHWHLVAPRQYRLAFWGHGANFQAQDSQSLRERFKRWTTNRVDWWFAYTDLSADLVAARGFPRNRISTVDNAVDTAQMRKWAQEISEEETRALRQGLGIEDALIGVFVGSLYADKRLDFLFAAAQAIRIEIPGFCLLIIGDGPERQKVQAWCQKHSWVHWVGARFDREKVAYLSMAQVMVNPSLVGLGILDSFVTGVPMATTNERGHGPEIVYLCHGVNGIMTTNEVRAYSAAVVALLRDEGARAQLRAGCHESGDRYTLENMVQRFAEGIATCLQSPRYDRKGIEWPASQG
ncbi:MAG: glycosyltransferase family 4 protein [Nitrospira sp.]|nr:glycosyltransferase family 4 protein [Nitrospira sp.]